MPEKQPLRIAWLSEFGGPGSGGVPKLAAEFVRELLNLGVRIDIFTPTDTGALETHEWARSPEVRIFSSPYSWDWNSWYGRFHKLAFIVSFFKRIGSHRRLAQMILRAHRLHPYDAVLQFSQSELLALRSHAAELPIFLYPQVHAAGELRWCRNEEPLARQCEPWWWRRFRNLYLGCRAMLQKRDYHLARGVLGVSHRFNQLVSQDCGLPPARQGVVYHPIDFAQILPSKRHPDDFVRLLFVGRISVRKGLDLLLRVLPRLLASDARIGVTLVGSGALWSNYEPLMKGLPGERCEWRKSVPNEQIIELMSQSDILLVPSPYEPGGIVVAEAMACGMVLLASNEIGAAEGIGEPIRWAFPASDDDAFLAAAAKAVAAVRSDGPRLRMESRRSASGRFESAVVARQMLAELEKLIGASHGEGRC